MQHRRAKGAWLDWLAWRTGSSLGRFLWLAPPLGAVESHRWGKQCHYWPVLQLADGIYMSSLEFIYLQAANQLDELGLAFLGCEICGRYYFDEAGEAKMREQLCSKGQIRRFLNEHSDARGAKKALRTLDYVLEGSGSPMETELALRLSLPCRLGGRGIVAPELNRSIALGPIATSVFGRDRITPDCLWESYKFALEYESDENHTGADRIANDSRRRLTLETAGYDVITVTNEQMRSVRDFEAIANHVARKTKKRQVTLGAKALDARAKLDYRLHRLAIDPTLTSCM